MLECMKHHLGIGADRNGTVADIELVDEHENVYCRSDKFFDVDGELVVFMPLEWPLINELIVGSEKTSNSGEWTVGQEYPI